MILKKSPSHSQPLWQPTNLCKILSLLFPIPVIFQFPIIQNANYLNNKLLLFTYKYLIRPFTWMHNQLIKTKNRCVSCRMAAINKKPFNCYICSDWTVVIDRVLIGKPRPSMFHHTHYSSALTAMHWKILTTHKNILVLAAAAHKQLLNPIKPLWGPAWVQQETDISMCKTRG